MEQEVDQNRLCCGGLLEAEMLEGRVVLRCLSCGKLWKRLRDGTMRSANRDGTALKLKTDEN